MGGKGRVEGFVERVWSRTHLHKPKSEMTHAQPQLGRQML